jgi:hypothetical protein
VGRVFVTQQPVKNRRNWVPNLQPATQYGAIHFIFTGEERPHENPTAAVEQAAKALATFRADEDYILWPNTGDPAAVWATIIALSQVCLDDYVNILYWDRKLVHGVSSKTEGFYVAIKFPLSVSEQRPF